MYGFFYFDIAKLFNIKAKSVIKQLFRVRYD